MEKIKKPRSKKIVEKKKKSLTDEQINSILLAVKENEMIDLWVHILLYTGCRPSEALALTFKDINTQTETITINKTLGVKNVKNVITEKETQIPVIKIINKGNGSGLDSHLRTLKVSTDLIKKIKAWELHVKSNIELMEKKRINGIEENLFFGSKGQLWKYLDYKHLFDRLLNKSCLSAISLNGFAEESIFPYRFRANFATRTLRQGIDVKTTQLMMGHNTSAMITKHYADMNEDDVLIGSKKFADNMDKTINAQNIS